MQSFPPTIILRHQRENLKKCSLRGFESRTDFKFYTYPKSVLPDLSGYVLLTLDAPVLSLQDSACGLFILDSTWRYAEKMLKFVDQAEKNEQKIVRRSLPSHFRTAYPRRQDDCKDPARGLASIEAIYLSYYLLGRDVSGLLDSYYWADQFLTMNISAN